MKRKEIVLKGLMVIALVAVVLIPLSSGAAESTNYRILVKVDGIMGEVTDAQYRDWIEAIGIEDRVFSMANAQKANFGPVRIVKNIDKTSVKLREWVADRRRIKSVNIHVLRMQANVPVKYLEIRLSDVIIVEAMFMSGQLLSQGIQPPREAVSFQYNRVVMTYYHPDPAKAPSTFGWDVPANRLMQVK